MFLLSLKNCLSFCNLLRLLNPLIISLKGGLDKGMCFNPSCKSWILCFERECWERLWIPLVIFVGFSVVSGNQNLLSVLLCLLF